MSQRCRTTSKNLSEESATSPVRRDLLEPDRCASDGNGDGADPILSLRGLGKDIWANEETDSYVKRLRGGWDDQPLKQARRKERDNRPDR